MAELRFDVRANFEEVTKLRSECEKLRAELLKTNKSTDPAIVADLTERYADASNRLKDLTQAASRAAYVMSSEFNKKMQAAAREVYSYELQMQATKDRIEKIQQQITNKRLTLGVTTDKSSIDSLQKNIDYLKGSLAGQTAQLKNLEGGAVGARQTLENMRNEYVLYAGSANPAKDATNMLTDSMNQMIERMKSAPTAGEGMSSLFQRVTGDAHMLSAALLGGLGFEQLASSIFNTRSQFQQLEISFTTMLGSADKSKQLMDELIQTAAHTPFDMSSITSGAKQLLAYGTEAKDVNKTLVQLGDIASGLNIPLGDLVYLYGTTVAQGRMFTMDLRQFMGRGVPLAEELGKILHQNTTEVQESVSKGKVTSDIFKEAIANMTQAGGRFGGLMEQQSKTLEGQWSNIGDSIQQMFNEIGKKSEGVFSSGLSIISAMVENWQEVIKVIGVAVVAVGSYRASLMAAASIRKAEEAQQADDMMKGIDSEIKRLQDLEKANNKYLGKDSKTERINKQSELAKEVADTSISDDFIKAQLEQATQEGVITEEMKAQLEAKRELLQAQQQATAQSQMEVDEEKRKTEELRQQKIESLKSDLTETSNKLSSLNDRDVELAKEYVDAMGELADAQDALSEANKLVEETVGGANLAFDSEGNAVNALEAKERLETATKQVNTAQTKLNTIESEQNAITTSRESLTKKQATIQNELNTVSEANNTTAKKAGILATTTATVKNALYAAGTKYTTTVVNLFSGAVRSSSKALSGLWATMVANPIGALIALGTTLYSVFSMFGDEAEEISADTSHFGESASQTANKVTTLMEVMKNTESTTEANKKAKEELISIYEQYGVKCDAEKDTLQTLKDKHDSFTNSLKLENVEREKANALMAISSQYDEGRSNLDKQFADDLGGSWLDFGQHIKKEDISAVQMMFNQLVPDEALGKIDNLKKKMDSFKKGTDEYSVAAQNYDKALRGMLAPFEEWGKKMGYNSFQIASMKSAILGHVDGINSLKDSYKRADNAIQKASKSTSTLSYKQNENALKTRYARKSFNELNSEIQATIDRCSRKYSFTVKAHYDDSELPAWIKGMSKAQLKSSMAARKNWLDTNPKKGSVLKIGGHYETVEDATRTLNMMRSRGTNTETKPTSNNGGKTTTKTTPKKDTDDPQARAYERKKATEDYSNTISSYSEKAEESLIKKRTDLIKNETEKEIAQINQSTDKEKKAIEDGIDKLVEAKKKEDQTVWVNSGKNRKANMWKATKSDAQYRADVMGTTMKDSDGKSLGVTIGQNAQDQIALLEQQRRLKLKEIQQAEIKDMLDFMKQYGSLEQQRYATWKEYTDKIDIARESGDTYGAANLEMEMEDKLKQLNFTSFKDSINWDSVFQDMARQSVPYLEDLRKKLKDLLGSGTLEIDDMKVVSDQIYKIDDAISEQTNRWGIVNEAVREHKRLLEEANDAQARLTQARNVEMDAKEVVGNSKKKIQDIFAESGINVSTSKITSKNKNSLIKDNVMNLNNSQLERLNKAFDGLAISETKASKATEDVQKAQTEFKTKTDAAKKSIYDIADEWGTALGNVANKLKDLNGLVDSLGLGNTGFGKAVANGMDALNSGQQALSDFKDGNYIGAAMNSINTIKSIGRVFGIGNGSNAKEVAETTEKLTEANERLEYSINKLKDSIDKSSGMSAVKNYDKAYEAQKQINANSIEILKTQMGYHGAHHSNNYYWNLSKKDYSAINKTLAQQKEVRGGYTNSTINKVSSLEDIYKLTPEQMADIRTYNQDVWKNMLDQGKYDKSEYWENYTELAEQLDSLTEQINQNLTQTSFDSMKQDFISNLMDMNKSAKEFSNDFTTMLTQSMLQFAMSDLMESKLKPLYEKWAGVMRDEKRNLTKAEIDSFKQEYDELTKEGMAIRDNIADITGYKQSYEQSASSGAFESMSQDTGDELNGRFTAVQIATEGTYQVVQSIDQKLSQMLGLDSRSKEIVGATKEEPQPKKEETDNVTKTISDKLSKKMDDMVNDSLNFKGSTLGMIDSINKHRLLSGKHSLEYESGLSTEDLADFINSKRTDMFRTSISELQQAVNQQVVTDTPNTRGDSLLTADISSICQNVGNIYVAVDEGRTILAQSMMYLQSIDERQESWHKPMLQAFNDIHELKDKMSRL